VVVPDAPPAKRGRGRPRKQVQTESLVAEPQVDLLLQSEETAATAASTAKRSTRGLFPKLNVGGRRS
jgi:hypothetical protein